LETLARVKKSGKAFAVLGDMLEMGDDTATLHRQIGRKAAKQGMDYLLAIGKQACHLLAGAGEMGMSRESLTEAEEHRELALKVHRLMDAGDWVLVKGSRGMRMEKVVEALIELRGNGTLSYSDHGQKSNNS